MKYISLSYLGSGLLGIKPIKHRGKVNIKVAFLNLDH
jgi:hypothetical protein